MRLVSLRPFLVWFSLSFLGFLVGLFLGAAVPLPEGGGTIHVAEVPLPHQVPKLKEGLSLRLAMVHDVLVQRYTRHSAAWYEARNDQVRAKLAELEGGPVTDEMFALYDDLGVGLERLGKQAEAVALFRKKLRMQEELGLKGRDLYTTYANLSTVMIHERMFDAMTGDAAALKGLEEAAGILRKAIEVNPDAHFGRETWQIIAVEYILHVIRKPDLLLKYDLTGNRLGGSVEYGRMVTRPESWGRMTRRTDADIIRTPTDENARLSYRAFIFPMRPAAEWRQLITSKPADKVPFDEPVLAIIGMWTLGGGPSPHFGLALGEIMFRIGQKRIAWTAYERAIRMGNRFWPDPAIREKLVEHCRARQKSIEEGFPRSEVESLRSRFDAELQHGIQWQEALADYEEEQLRAGRPVEDPSFHDAFLKKHGAIGSDPGLADWMRVERVSGAWAAQLNWMLAFGVLVAGLFSLGYGILWMRR